MSLEPAGRRCQLGPESFFPAAARPLGPWNSPRFSSVSDRVPFRAAAILSGGSVRRRPPGPQGGWRGCADGGELRGTPAPPRFGAGAPLKRCVAERAAASPVCGRAGVKPAPVNTSRLCSGFTEGGRGGAGGAAAVGWGAGARRSPPGSAVPGKDRRSRRAPLLLPGAALPSPELSARRCRAGKVPRSRSSSLLGEEPGWRGSGEESSGAAVKA